MPIFLITAAATFSSFLYCYSSGRYSPWETIIKILYARVKKIEKTEYWEILDTFYFELNSSEDDRMCCRFFKQLAVKIILSIIASTIFLLVASYFMDQSIIMQRSYEDWPHRSDGEIDCFIWAEGSLLYVNPNEQDLTDRLENCTVFFEQCVRNCTSIINDCNASDNCTDDFMTCSDACTDCLQVCSYNLRSDIERVRVCDPPPSPPVPSCPVSIASCISLNPAAPIPNSSCPLSGVGATPLVEIGPLIFSNNTERLQSCANLLDTCSRNIQSCSNPNCNQLTECVNALQPCHKSRTIHCFRFLQFGLSTNVLESVERSFALFLALIHFLNGIFFVLKILYQFSIAKCWAVLFILMLIFYNLFIVGWMVLLVTNVPAQGNTMKISQLVFGFIMIWCIAFLLLFFEEKSSDESQIPSKIKVDVKEPVEHELQEVGTNTKQGKERFPKSKDNEDSQNPIKVNVDQQELKPNDNEDDQSPIKVKVDQQELRVDTKL